MSNDRKSCAAVPFSSFKREEGGGGEGGGGSTLGRDLISEAS